MKVEVMKDDAPLEVDEQCTTIWGFGMKDRPRTDMNDVPSSTLNNTFASGLRAIAEMSFRFSNGNVWDLLLLGLRVQKTLVAQGPLT